MYGKGGGSGGQTAGWQRWAGKEIGRDGMGQDGMG